MTWRPTLDRSRHALYRELAEQLERDIAAGTLKPGTKLPPQRELADFLDINVSTVSKAFKACELKGLLTAAVGSGTFVAYSALTDRRFLTPSPEREIIDMATALPDDSANDVLAETARHLFKNGGGKTLFSFNSRGEEEWRRDVAVQFMERCGHKTHRDQILFANGGQNAIAAVLASLFRQGDKIAVDDHTYPGIKAAAAMFGIKLVPVRTGAKGMDPADLDRLCRSEGIHGVYIISACHNPTTATLPHDARKAIAAVVRRQNLLLIEDGSFQLLENGGRAVSDFAPERSVYIASLSQVIAPGLRSAYLSVPQRLYGKTADALETLNIGTAPLMAELAARTIASGQFERIVAVHKEHTARRSELVSRLLPQAKGCSHHMYRWLPLPRGTDSAAFEREALARGVQLYAAERFAVGKTAPACAVRFAVTTPPTAAQLEKGLEIIVELLDELWRR
jgi:DNA-binding transcriptional MocR family regulator